MSSPETLRHRVAAFTVYNTSTGAVVARYCTESEARADAAWLNEYGPTGARYGYSIHEDSAIYPNPRTAIRCTP